MYSRLRLSGLRGGAVALLLLLSGCALNPPAPLWQPPAWPLATYRVEWPATGGSVSLWVAIEADASGVRLVAFSPEGVKLLGARYSAERLEQEASPLRPAGLDAAILLQAWQLAFGPPATVAAAYGSGCALVDTVRAGTAGEGAIAEGATTEAHPATGAQAGGVSAGPDSTRILSCGGKIRARVQQRAVTSTVQIGASPAQQWTPLDAGDATATVSP